MGNLQDLQKHRKDILLAEVAAWLHDMGKCADAFLQPSGMGFNAHVCQNNPRVNPHKAVYSPQELQNLPYWSSLSPQRGQCSRLEEAKHPTALWRTLQTISFTSQKLDILINLGAIGQICLRELILWGRPLVADRYRAFQRVLSIKTHLAAILGQSHNRAHMEKEDEADGGQSQELEMPFGYYRASLDDLNTKLKRVLDVITNSQIPRGIKLYILKKQFASAPGDTRRPINEVTLWAWSSIVAALYKAEIARCVLTEQKRQPQDVAWRLLSLRTDGLAYMLSAPSIPDLLARKDLLTDAWNRVQKVLEADYPLGLEVYRDENGPVFVVPDLDNLLGLENPDDNHKTLREYIAEAFRQGTVKGDARLAINGEVVPWADMSRSWSGQKDPNTGQLDLPPIGDMLEETPPLQSDPAAIAQAWCHHTEEICSVCGLRPQGPGRKAKRRKMCDICEERRADRAQAWAVNLGSAFLGTIWLDEVADANGRLALIVGQFDLTHWLEGTLVRSLAVRTPNNQNGHTEDEVAKNPSFARLRRIWETTRRFWQDVAPTDPPPEELRNFCNSNGLDIKDLWEGPLSLEDSVAGKAIGGKRARIFLKAANADELAQRLGPFHAYEMVVQGRKVAVLWVPPEGEDVKDIPEENRGGFWVIENLNYLERIFGKPFEQVLQESDLYEIYEPSEYARPGRPIAQLHVEEDVQEVRDAYTPLIPILAEPRTFMALVPADKALDVVRAIKAKYEREMGKVRNRLPLHLGVVYADSHTPLRAVLDAGRRMLAQKAADKIWRVVGDQERQMAEQQGIPILHITEMGKAETQLENERPELIYEDPQQKTERITEQYKTWHRIVLQSQKPNRVVYWYAPAVMGDGQTEDHWYPYVFWQQDKDGKTDPGNATQPRTRYYQAPNPFDCDPNGNPQSGWLVHAGELKEGDVIYFTPATFDFIWLDHGGTRFEITYDEDGRRRGTLHRPYLLDELDDLLACWKLLAGDREKKIKRLGTSQLHAVRDLIETKRAEWFQNHQDSLEDETFRRHCESVLKNAQWATKPEPHDLARLTHWAVTGLLADAVELFYHIMKQRPEGET